MNKKELESYGNLKGLSPFDLHNKDNTIGGNDI